MPGGWDWSVIKSYVQGGVQSRPFLQVGHNYILLALVNWVHDRYQWLEMADNDWDELDAILSDIEWELMQEGVCGMIGSVAFFAGDLPDNVLLCDGTQYARVDYPLLYAALDAVFIVDADNFVTPNIQERVILGTRPLRYAVGDTGGQAGVTLTVAEMPRHNHRIIGYSPNIDVEGAGAPDPLAVGLPETVRLSTFAGNNEPHENRQPYIALNPGIVAS